MTSVAVIGTGFGGLVAAVRLEQAGIDEPVPARDRPCVVLNTTHVVPIAPG